MSQQHAKFAKKWDLAHWLSWRLLEFFFFLFSWSYFSNFHAIFTSHLPSSRRCSLVPYTVFLSLDLNSTAGACSPLDLVHFWDLSAELALETPPPPVCAYCQLPTQMPWGMQDDTYPCARKELAVQWGHEPRPSWAANIVESRVFVSQEAYK